MHCYISIFLQKFLVLSQIFVTLELIHFQCVPYLNYLNSIHLNIAKVNG